MYIHMYVRTCINGLFYVKLFSALEPSVMASVNSVNFSSTFKVSLQFWPIDVRIAA